MLQLKSLLNRIVWFLLVSKWFSSLPNNMTLYLVQHQWFRTLPITLILYFKICKYQPGLIHTKKIVLATGLDPIVSTMKANTHNHSATTDYKMFWLEKKSYYWINFSISHKVCCAQSTDDSIFSLSLITQRWIQGSREESRYSKVQGWIWGGFPGDIQDSGRDSGFREGFRIQGGIQDSGRDSGFRKGVRIQGWN